MRTITLRSLMLVILPGCFSWKGVVAATFEVSAVTPAALTGDIDPASAQIVVAFDRPIVPLGSNENKDALPDPLTLEPEARGQGEWITTALYVFQIQTGTLRANTEYTGTVRAGLKAVDGSVLEKDYVWTFRTLAPQVIHIRATEKFSTCSTLLDSGFEMTFSQPMNPTSTEAAFHLWLDPDDPLLTGKKQAKPSR